MIATTSRPLRDLRLAAAAVIAAGAVWPALPVHPPPLCPLRTATGIPCPFCGMTRAVVAALHGDLAASLQYNPGGVVVVAVAVVLLVRPASFAMARLPAHAWAWALAPPVAAVWAYNIGWNPTFG